MQKPKYNIVSIVYSYANSFMPFMLVCSLSSFDNITNLPILIISMIFLFVGVGEITSNILRQRIALAKQINERLALAKQINERLKDTILKNGLNPCDMCGNSACIECLGYDRFIFEHDRSECSECQEEL